jgi:beta-galactosidase
MKREELRFVEQETRFRAEDGVRPVCLSASRKIESYRRICHYQTLFMGGSMGLKKMFLSTMIAAAAASLCSAQVYTGEPSNRVTINLGETSWKFTKSDPAGGAQAVTYNDAGWKDIGIPHTWNDTDTFINQRSGGGDGSMAGGTCWYRKHFTLDNAYAARKVFFEVEGAHVGAAAYINGTFIPGNSALNPNATHVVGFTGFVVDLTPYVHFGGADNVIAVRVGKSGGFYDGNSNISSVFRFGQNDGGMFRPVWLHITDKIHIPMNVYSVLNTWGTYVATTAASDASAMVRLLTNVANESAAAASVTVTTKIVDMSNNVVWTGDQTQTVNAGSSMIFDQTATITNPHLWYPNNSIYGTPYMHKVYHIVKVGGNTIDVAESPLGIRTITWDANFPYINGKKHFLWGASARYDYPALGTALPNEVEWRDAQLLAACGGNLWRPGHSACSRGFVQACDYVGIMIIQPSGEGEGSFSSTSITPVKATMKKEIHRDGIVRDRNDPCILAWEASNAAIDPNFADTLRMIDHTFDSLTPRAQSVRGGPQFAPGDLIACTLTGCEIGLKNGHPLCPAWGAEAWGRQSSRFAYDFEISFAAEFVQNWRKSWQGNCFGLCQWYLAETPGEVGDFLEMKAGVETRDPRSFGSSMMDFNRIPKMLYKIYAACWIPYSIKPVVYIAHHWNRSGTVRVNVFSNCPSVKLRLNGTDLGNKTPNPSTGAGSNNDLTETTTQLPFQCYWDNVTWAAGTLRAEGLNAGGTVVCSDEKKTAGAPHHIVLTQDPPVVKPTGEVFKILNNGTDAALILATVVDENGIWCPTASNVITFSVSGPGNYRGGTDQWVSKDSTRLGYHAPLDPNLSAEGGMCKVAVRSTFQTGTVTITATSPGLVQGSTTFTVYPCSTGQTYAINMGHKTQSATMPLFKLGVDGKVIRYYIGAPSMVSIDLIDAKGRVVRQVVNSRQLSGWHPVPISGETAGADAKGCGVYFARFTVNGQEMAAKRILVIR